MSKFVFEVIEEVSKAKAKAKKIEILKQYESWALKDILRGTYDDTIQWIIPEGKPPYTPAGKHVPSNLTRQNTQFKFFAKGGPGEQMLKAKREKIYITLLESIHPQDAELVISMISKDSIKGITKDLVKEAFPGLIKS